jgi:ribosomal-protein-alanine N-acetyltransferase
MLHLTFPTFPVLYTSRLVLRQLKKDDSAQIHQLRSDPEVNKLLGRATSKNLDEAAEFINKISTVVAAKEGLYWAISLHGQASLIGTICFWNLDIENNAAEVGYELLPAYQRKGLMTEAVNCAMEFAFRQLQAEVITAFPSADNFPSIRLLQKTGFKIADQPDRSFPENADNLIKYSLVKDHFVC